MSLLAHAPSKGWILAGVLALGLSGVVQYHVENRREEAHLTLTGPEEKQALEVGFFALGGFRGILADVLWIRAQQQQDTARYYELKLLCDMILKLQPTFTQVHAYQAWNMAYNLAFKAETCQDKWYWIRTGISTLEKGLQRNLNNHTLWFEMGSLYYDRLSDIKMGDCRAYRTQELPNLDDLKTDEMRRMAFSEELGANGQRNWAKGRARNDEQMRFAAYFFWKAMETKTDPLPIRTERMYGQCIDHLRHWVSSKKNPEDRKEWTDWGSEDWWVEMIKRNKERGLVNEITIPSHLRFCMYAQMDHFLTEAKLARQKGDTKTAATYDFLANGAYNRFRTYFVYNQKSLPELMDVYHGYLNLPR